MKEDVVREWSFMLKPEDWDILIKSMSLNFFRQNLDKFHWTYYMVLQVMDNKALKDEFEDEIEQLMEKL